MKNTAADVESYLKSLPEARREPISIVREVILASLPNGYEECMSYGMIGYVVPHSLYPAGYHCDPTLPLPLACLGAQKNYLSLHLMNVYGDPVTERWFRAAWLATGKKLNMGKACVRFKHVEDVPLEVIGQVIARTPVKDYVARVEAVLGARAKKPAAGRRRRTKTSRA